MNFFRSTTRAGQTARDPRQSAIGDKKYQSHIRALFGEELDEDKVSASDLARMIEELREEIRDAPEYIDGVMMPPKHKRKTHAMPPAIFALIFRFGSGQRLFHLRPQRHIAPDDDRQADYRKQIDDSTAADLWAAQEAAADTSLGKKAAPAAKPTKQYWNRLLFHSLASNPRLRINELKRAPKVQDTGFVFRDWDNPESTGPADVVFSGEKDVLYLDEVYIKEYHSEKMRQSKAGLWQYVPFIPQLAFEPRSRVRHAAIDAASARTEDQCLFVVWHLLEYMPHLETLLVLTPTVTPRMPGDPTTATLGHIGDPTDFQEGVFKRCNLEQADVTLKRLRDAYQRYEEQDKGSTRVPQMEYKVLCFFQDQFPATKVKDVPTVYISDSEKEDNDSAWDLEGGGGL